MLTGQVCIFGEVSVAILCPLLSETLDSGARAPRAPMSQPHIRGTVGPLCICLSFWQRGGRDWAEHSQRLEEHQERAWPGTVDAGTAGREHLRWQGMGSPLPEGQGGLPGRASHSPSMLQRASFSRASKCRLFLLFQVVRGACLGPRGQGMWQVGVEYRGKKYCPRIKLICSHFSLPLPFSACLIHFRGRML